MGATLTSMNAALKRVYHSDSLSEQLFQENELLDLLQKQTRYKVGENHRVVLHTGRAGGTTYLPDGGGNLNTAGQQTLNKADYVYKHVHQPINIQEDVIEQTASDAQSVAQVLDVEVTGALNDLRKSITRTLFGNGDSLICGVRTANSTTVDLELLDGYNAVQRGWLYPNMQIDIGTTANEVSVLADQTISSVTVSATDPEIVIGNAANVTAGTHFISLNNARSGTTAYEPAGLRNLVSTSSAFGGLAADSVWRAAGVDTTAQAVTSSLVLQGRQAIRQNSTGDADFILTGLKQERKFWEQESQKVRYVSDSSIDTGNSDKVKFAGMELMVHPDCPNEDLYLGQKKALFHVASRKPFWQNSITGGDILVWSQGTAAYVAKLGFHFNLATDRRNVFYRLGGLT
jgi:hypothetical protein